MDERDLRHEALLLFAAAVLPNLMARLAEKGLLTRGDVDLILDVTLLQAEQMQATVQKPELIAELRRLLEMARPTGPTR